MKNIFISLLPAIFLSFFSCTKEKIETPTNLLEGHWNLYSMEAHIVGTKQTGGISQTITLDYVTKNNKGAITVNSSDITYTGIGYSVDTFFLETTDFSGAPTGPNQFPEKADVLETTATTPYREISSDSLLFDNGSSLLNWTKKFLSNRLGVDLQISPITAAYKINNGELHFTFKIDQVIPSVSDVTVEQAVVFKP